MIKRFVYYALTRGVVVSAQLLLIPVAVTQLGVAGYGVYSLMVQAALLIRLVCLQATAQTIARGYARLVSSHGEPQLYSMGALVLVLALVAAAAPILFFTSDIGEYFGLMPGQVLIALAMGAAVSFFGLRHTFLYSKNFRAFTLWDTLQPLSVVLLPVFVGLLYPLPDAYGLVYAGITLFLTLLMMRARVASFSVTTMRSFLDEIRVFGVPLLVGEIFGWIVAVADRFQIAAMLDTTQTGIYSAAYQLFVPPIALLGLATVIQPDAFAGDSQNLVRRLRSAATVTTVVSTLYLGVVSIAGESIFSLFFRDKAEIDFMVVFTLAATGIASAFYYLELVSGKYQGRVGVILATQAVAGIFVLVVNYVFLPRVGIIAAALSSFGAYLVQIALLRYRGEKALRFTYFSLAVFSEMMGKSLRYMSRTLK